MNLSDLQQRFLDEISNDTYLSNPAQMTRYANDAIVRMRSWAPDMEDQSQFLSVPQQKEYNLPDDMVTLSSVEWNGIPLQMTTYEEAERMASDYDTPQPVPILGDPEWFYIRQLTNGNNNTFLGQNPNLFPTINPPPPPFTVSQQAGGGSITGVYYYAVTYTVNGVEYYNGNISLPVTASSASILGSFTVPPAPPNTTLIKLYRTLANGTVLFFNPSVITLTSPFRFQDSVADGSLGASIPSVNVGPPARNVMGTYPIANSAFPFLITYSKRPPLLVNPTDVPAFPDEYHEMIVYYMLWRGWRKAKEYDVAAQFKSYFDEEIAKLRMYYKTLKPDYTRFIRNEA